VAGPHFPGIAGIHVTQSLCRIDCYTRYYLCLDINCICHRVSSSATIDTIRLPFLFWLHGQGATPHYTEYLAAGKVERSDMKKASAFKMIWTTDDRQNTSTDCRESEDSAPQQFEENTHIPTDTIQLIWILKHLFISSASGAIRY
jgi:hypothetical protein